MNTLCFCGVEAISADFVRSSRPGARKSQSGAISKTTTAGGASPEKRGRLLGASALAAGIPYFELIARHASRDEGWLVTRARGSGGKISAPERGAHLF
jgi:hypothetical protein